MTEQHKDYVAAVALVCLLAIMAVLVVMAYRHGKYVERNTVRTACEKAIAANNDGRLAMICDKNTLFVWHKETGKFMGAVDFDKAVKR